MGRDDKPLVWLAGEVKTQPWSSAARVEVGVLLRRLQRGEKLSLPHSRPMPSIGVRCHELRVRDRAANWRLIYRIELNVIVILDVFPKKTEATPERVIAACRERLRRFEAVE